MEVSEITRNQTIEKYYYLIIKAARKLGSKFHMPEDDLIGPGSEALVLASQDVDSQRSEQSTEHFLRRWIENYMMNAIRARKPAISLQMEDDGQSFDIEDQTSRHEIDRFEVENDLRKLIKSMPARYHDVFLTKLANPEATLEDIANALKIKKKDVQNILFSGRQILKRK